MCYIIFCFYVALIFEDFIILFFLYEIARVTMSSNLAEKFN